MNSRLVVSLSGISRRTLADCAEFAVQLDRRQVPLSLLFAPRPAGAERPTPDSPALGWVRAREAAGDAVLLHGFDHAAEPIGGWRPRLAPTASWPDGGIWRRAEFATLPAHEAGLRLLAAVRTVEGLGLRPDCFAPPRWLASAGTLVALRRRGFAVCADALAVRNLNSGAVHRGRVHGLGRGETAEPWWCRALVLGVARAARRGGLVRIAVDAADLGRSGPHQAVIDAVDIALHYRAEPVTYAAFTGKTKPPRPDLRIPTARTEVPDQVLHPRAAA